MMSYFKNLSITKKVLIVLLAIFSIYTVFGAGIQTLFFEKFYIYSKRDLLTKQIDSFSEKYAEMTDDDEINRALLESTGNDTYMLIMNENGDIINSTSFQLILKTDDGERVTFFLDHITRNKRFERLELDEHDRITVGYITPRGPDDKQGIYMPIKIITANGEFSFSEMPPRMYGDKDDKEHLQYITGEVVYAPTREMLKNTINRDESTHAVMDWMGRVFSGIRPQPGKSIHYIYQSNENMGTYCVVVKNLNDKNEMLCGVTTLKPVAEAVGVMQALQIIWFAIMGAVMIAVVFILTKRMTKPIKDIAAVTTNMKNLDFSQKCKVTSKDELGMLAENVNSMSAALDAAIRDLKSANEKLTDDIERERRIEQNRREFVATVSHELKTPLAIIRAYSEGILDGVSENKRKRYLEVIADETKKMDALVLDMLDNSKLEAGAEQLIIKKHNLAALTENIVNIFAVKCKAKGIDIYLERDDEVTASFDINRIEQVITNFISNAVRHTPEGGAIYVTVKNDGAAVCTVENTGKHIDDEDLPKLWDRFYKADKSRERIGDGGTGLGLSIAKNILVLHNAEYFVKNTRRGVMFGFKL